jgi:hypothetical protein
MRCLPGVPAIWSARCLSALALCLLLGAALREARAADAPALSPISDTAKATSVAWVDPLENYYDNTLVCAAAITGNDLCHLWLSRDGSFINFDGNGAHTGHYQVGPMRPDGKVPVCQFWDTTNMLFLPGVPRPMMGPPPGAAGAAPTMTLCHTTDFHTSCRRGVDPATMTAQEIKESGRNMAERFYNGMCYPLGPHHVGDSWFEDDDPLPGQASKDKLLLIPGHQ